MRPGRRLPVDADAARDRTFDASAACRRIYRGAGALEGQGLVKLQLWLWFVGMMVLTLPWHWVGLLGMPRRMAYYDFSDPAIQPQAWTVVASTIGGIPEIVGSGNSSAGHCLVDCAPELLAAKIEDARSRGVTFGRGAKARFQKLFSPEAFDVRLREILSFPSDRVS